MTSRTGKLRSVRVHVAGLPMHARVSAGMAGIGPPVVLVHGLVVSGRYMVPLASQLAPYCLVAIPDLPGFGESASPPHVPEVAELADALNRWMDAVGLVRAALVANSFGCQVAADLAARYPERVDRMVMIGPTVDPSHRGALQMVSRWVLDILGEPISLAPMMALDCWSAGLGRGLASFRHMMRDRIEEKLPRIVAPTLVVRGGRDPVAPQRWAEEAVRLLPLGRLAVIPGGTHVVHYVAPEAVARALMDFLGLGAVASAREAGG